MEKENKHSLDDLYQMQNLPLSVKVLMSKQRIRDWVNEHGTDNVCIQMTLTPESLVLLHLVYENYPGIEVAFTDSSKKMMTPWMACKDMDHVDDWLQYGCNHYESKCSISRPMAFWKQKDIKEYIKGKEKR